MAELNTVARPYTKAAFEYARDKGNLDQWSNLLSLAAQAVQDSELAQLLGNPALTVAQKAEAGHRRLRTADRRCRQELYQPAG